MKWFSIFATTALLFPAAAFAYPNQAALVNHVKDICSQTLEVTPDTYGPRYDILPTRFYANDTRAISAIDVFADGKTQIKLSVLEVNGTIAVHLIPRFDYKRILLADDSVWFLGDDDMKEYNLTEKKIVGTYSTYPRPFTVQLTTRARGFTYDKGYIYIAHGELGVSVFDVKNRKPYTVLTAGMQTASLAGAVQVRASNLYILLGAYHPAGFNGVSIVDMSSGGARTVAYPAGSGVVDPYSSNMQFGDNQLFINNSGWIHAYDLKSLSSGSSTIAPTWMMIFEKVDSEAGIFDKYLMVEGDLLVNDGDVLACSSVSYVPKKQRRPIKESRFIHQAI